MAISLYDATVLGFIQTASAIEGVLTRGLEHYKNVGTNPDEVLERRLHPDMLPLRFQAFSVIRHSVDAIQNVKAGVFTRPPETPKVDYAGLQSAIADAVAKLKTFTPDEVNALEGRDMVFQMGEQKIMFTAEGFLLSFSVPNLHFHATTTYDILRTEGVPLGKRDYLGRLRLKA